jgi:hypothetical protein
MSMLTEAASGSLSSSRRRGKEHARRGHHTAESSGLGSVQSSVWRSVNRRQGIINTHNKYSPL